MESIQLDMAEYKERFRPLFKAMDEAFIGCAVSGDEIGLAFLLDHMNLLVCTCDQIVSEVRERTGTA